MLEIPFSGAPRESFDMTLDGRLVTIRVAYAFLSSTWYLDLIDRTVSPSVPLIQGMAVRTGIDMLKPYGFGMGALVAVAIERPGDDPVRAELGGRVRVVHVPRAELA